MPHSYLVLPTVYKALCNQQCSHQSPRKQGKCQPHFIEEARAPGGMHLAPGHPGGETGGTTLRASVFLICKMGSKQAALPHSCPGPGLCPLYPTAPQTAAGELSSPPPLQFNAKFRLLNAPHFSVRPRVLLAGTEHPLCHLSDPLGQAGDDPEPWLGRQAHRKGVSPDPHGLCLISLSFSG